MYKRRNGFTIVELLIVIVVIGILAAIALNSYAGIQRNARNQQNVSLAQAWHKALLAYAVANGNAYPSEMAGGTEVYFCLGSYPDVDSNGTGDCQVAANGTTSLASTIPSFNTK
ncbi:MAG: type II secretion system protein, partial [Candidatus Doudnabacteria bacterium]|nr:type II secretion system protein [Candidatus Doudnabacteria bacterium]